MNRKISFVAVLTLGALLAGAVLVVPSGGAEAAASQCLKGEVVSMSKRAVTLRYAIAGKIIRKAFRITVKQYNSALGRNVRNGSQVQVCFKKGAHKLSRTSLLGNILQRLRRGQNIEEAPGGENAGAGAGGGGGGGGT